MTQSTHSTLTSIVTGQPKAVTYGDPCWCRLDECRVRYVRHVDGTSVEVMDDRTGRVLPDLRHPTQLLVY
jgi:hypothetical protein